MNPASYGGQADAEDGPRFLGAELEPLHENKRVALIARERVQHVLDFMAEVRRWGCVSWLRSRGHQHAGVWGAVHFSEYGADQGKRDRRSDRSYHGTKRDIHQTDTAAAPPTTVGGAGRLLDWRSRFRR